MNGDPIKARLDSLLALTPIPEWAVVNDWPEIEADLGFVLPAEYKAYADRFPSGRHRWLEVFHPDGPDMFGIVQQTRKYARMFTGFHLNRVFYPQPGGLIPWAEFEAETCLFWRPDGDDPDTWPVVACSSTGKYEEIPGSTIEALVAVLHGDAGRIAFPEALYDDPLMFIPMDPRVSVKFGILNPADIGEE